MLCIFCAPSRCVPRSLQLLVTFDTGFALVIEPLLRGGESDVLKLVLLDYGIERRSRNIRRQSAYDLARLVHHVKPCWVSHRNLDGF